MLYRSTFFPCLFVLFWSLSGCDAFFESTRSLDSTARKIFHVDADFRPIYFKVGLPRFGDGLEESVHEPKEQQLQVVDENLELFLSAGNDFEYGLEVVGHASSSECKEGGCIQLSERRAKLVADWLLAKGLRKERLVRTVGLGTRYPVGDEETEVGRGGNRRVEIHLTEQPSLSQTVRVGQLLHDNSRHECLSGSFSWDVVECNHPFPDHAVRSAVWRTP